jgi:hypothetical protein
MNRPDFLVFRWCATYCWKTFDKGYKFSSNLISIGGLHTNLWAPKVAKVLTLKISGFPFGSPRTKWHLGASLMAKHRVYYKGEGGGFPTSGPWWVLWICVQCTKVLQLCTNQLVVWFVQVRMNKWIACQSS